MNTNYELRQTLSKALDMSRKTLLTLKTFSKDWYMSWVTDNNWLIDESPGFKPGWLGD